MEPVLGGPDPMQIASPRMLGHCTPQGTSAYTDREWSNVGANHWRTAMGLKLSSVGIGTYLGENDDMTDEKVVHAITRAVCRGVNVIDTAINYRGQRAERCVGKAVNTCIENGYMRKELFIASKAGYIPSDMDRGLRSRDVAIEWSHMYQIPREEIVEDMHCMHPRFLEASLSHTLKNMWLDQIDLLYLHNTAEMQLSLVGKQTYMNRLTEAFRWLEEARRKGNIRFYGMATWSCFTTPENSPEHLELEEVVQLARVAGGDGHGMRFIQLPINPHMLQACTTPCQTINGARMSLLEAAETLGVLVMSSRSIGAARPQELEEVRRVYQTCRVPAHLTPTDPAAMALQLTRSIHGVTTALVGMKGEHVTQDLEVVSMEPLDEQTVTRCIDTLQKSSI